MRNMSTTLCLVMHPVIRPDVRLKGHDIESNGMQLLLCRGHGDEFRLKIPY
jgi:hypothetical protein